jgi:hypothetical protein
MPTLNKKIMSDAEIITMFEPLTKEKGVYLKTKAVIKIVDIDYGGKILAVHLDIKCSFGKNESTRLRSLLKRNGFHSNGNGTFGRIIKGA